MKKQRLTLFVSALLALGLASCGGESAPASTPAETPASTATKTDTKTSTKSNTSKSTTSATSKSTTPAPVARPYIKLPFNSFEGSNFTEESVNKWEKGFTYKWTFWTSRAEEGITVAIGAQMSSSSHSDRSLYTNHEGASSSDPFESDEANDGTPRIQLANNGVESEVTHMTYGEAGLSADELAYFEIGNIAVKEGKNVITITTHASTGYRLLLGGEIRLLYQAGEADLQGVAQTPTYAISSVSIANEEEHAVLSYHVDYTVYDFDEVKALDWHAGFQGNQNAGGKNWNYYEITPLAYAEGAAAGEMLVKVNLDSLVANRYSSKFGIGLVPETSPNNAGQAQDIHFSGEAAAYTQTITVGTKTYVFKADGGDAYWNLPSLEVTDTAEPTYTISEVGMSQVNNRAIVTWTISYANYTLADIQAMDWQGAFQENDNVSHKGWDWIEYGAEKANPIAVVDAGVEGKAKIEMDVTDYDLNCYMGKLGVGLQVGGDNDGRAFDVRPELGQNSSFQIGDKLYEFMPKGTGDTWGLPALFINHAHVYEDVSTLMNADGKPVTVRECSTVDCHAREIVIDYISGITYGSDGVAKSAVQTKMEKGNHTSWKISVDKAIEGAELYFEGDATVNNNRYFFNQNKAVNPVNPITGEEYPDQPTNSADGEAEDAWRYMFGVGAVSEENPMQHPMLGGTFAEAGAGQKPMHFGNINLAAGENVINLYQMNIGFRLTFSGKVHIRYNTDATITGELPPHEHAWVAGEAKVNCYQKSNAQFTCECGEKKSEMAFGDYDDLTGTADATNPWKMKSGATVLWTIWADAAGEAEFHVGMAGSTNNPNSNFDPTKYAVKANNVAGTIIPALQTYSAMGLDCVGTTVKDIAFASVTLVEGWNVIELDVNNSNYRCYFGGNVALVY